MVLVMGVEIWDIKDRTLLACILTASCVLLVTEWFIVAGIIAIIASLFYFLEEISWDLNWRTISVLAISLGGLVLVILVLYSVIYTESVLFIAYAWIVVAIVLISMPLVFVFPKPSAAKLSGPLKLIGTASFTLQYSSNYKSNIEDGIGTEKTTLPVQCWFPMQKQDNLFDDIIERFFTFCATLWTSGHPIQQYDEGKVLYSVIVNHFKLPFFMLNHLCTSRSNSYYQANLDRILTNKDHKMPIAIFCHGMTGWRQIHSSLAESLASLGFLVIACDHAPDAMVSRPIGNVKESTKFNFAPPPGSTPQEEREMFITGCKRRMNDLQALLDHVTDGGLIDRYPELQDQLNLNHICMWGHSYGAGSVLGFCCQDSRVARVASLDSWVYPVPDELRERGVQTASILSISAEYWNYGKFQVPFRRDFIKQQCAPASASSIADGKYNFVMRGTGHQNFCDTILLSHPVLLRRAKVIGRDLNPYLVMSSLNKLIASYFLIPKHDTGNYGTVGEDDSVNEESVAARSETEKVIRHCQRGKTVTGHKVNFTVEEMKLLQKQLIEESALDGFCDDTLYEQVTERLIIGKSIKSDEIAESNVDDVDSDKDRDIRASML